MRIALDIDERLLTDAMARSGAKTKSEAVEHGLRALIRTARYRTLEPVQRLLSQSKLTEQDTLTIGRAIKQRMWKKSKSASG